MKSKRKLKKVMKHIIGDFTGVQWKDLDHKKVYAAIAAVVAVIVLIIVLVVTVVTGGNEEKPQQTEDTNIVVEEAPEAEKEVVEENPLEVDAYEEINELALKYFHGLSTGDIPLVEDVVDVLTDEERQTIEKKKDYIESYNDITCYTKKGLEEDCYVVFAAYEMKIYNIETPAPGIMALYVCTDADGELYIFNGEAPEELANYVLELAAEEDVAAVIADVDARYQQLLEEDEDLGKFAQTMLESQEAPAETEEPEDPVDEETEEPVDEETEEPEEQTQEEEPAQEEEATPEEETEATAVNKTMELTDAVRIRKERSADSDILTTAYTSELVTVLENYSDGWSKVDYNGTVGYCKTEFLKEAD